MLRAHGLRGDLKCRVITDFPEERFRKGKRLWLSGDLSKSRRIRAASVLGDLVTLSLEGIDDRDAAEAVRGQELLVRAADAVALPEGDFYWHEVIGLHAVDPEGRDYGVVDDILESGGTHHVYVVHGDLGEILIPAIKDVVQAIEPAEGRLVFQPIPGLLPESSSRGGGFARKRRPRRTPPPT